MKKIFVVALAFVSMLILSNCGPRADELAEKAQADMDARPDSTKQVQTLAEIVNLSTQTPDGKKFVKSSELRFEVKNVLQATEKIEDITAKYDGYLVYSNLQNRDDNYKRSRISRDSIVITKQIVVLNEMQLRVPNERLDSFIREMNTLITFLDYRVIRLNDVTLQFAANQKKTDRLTKYTQRQTNNIDTKTSKLSEKLNAEDKLLNRQNQQDELVLNSMALEDQVYYCNLSISIYQKPLIIKQVEADFEYVSEVKPRFFSRMWDSIVQGWSILAEVFLFLVKIWGVALLVLVSIIGFRYLAKVYKKVSKKWL